MTNTTVSIPEFSGAPVFYSVRCEECGHSSGWCDSEAQAFRLLRRTGCDPVRQCASRIA